MTDNNYVAMEKNVCPVCGVTHTHNTGILIHRQLRDIPEDKTITGYGLCKEHDELLEKDYLAMIVIKDPHESEKLNKVKMEDADRTGEIAHIKYEAFNYFTNCALTKETPMVFIDEKAVNIIKQRYEEETVEQEE